MAGYKLSHMLLMRQMADLTGTPIEHMSGDAVVHHFCRIYTGTLILNVGINAQHGSRLIAERAGDLIAFGRDYIANPDLAERIRRDAALNEPRPEYFYGSSATEFDHGAIVRKGTGRDTPRIIRIVIGNPLIMRRMVQHVPDAGSYAPVTILLDERSDGGVHLSYDRMASLLPAYENADALRVACEFDAKIEALLASVA
jgi:uncharacterized protein (DUF302 family)